MSAVMERPDEEFEKWMAAVDDTLRKHCGLTSLDLPDFLYYDAYESEQDPEDVAQEVLEENGFPF